MRIKTGRKYELNKKVMELAQKNQVNYRESEDDDLSVIKRVNIYITDKKGHILRDVTITFEGKEYKVGKYGLLITNFPNEEKDIIASSPGYKEATGHILLNAEYQTHNFFLALETSDEESEVISIDDTKDPYEDDDKFSLGSVLFKPPLDGTDEITTWAGRNSTQDGIYSAHGSFLTEGWSNSGLWKLEYDVAYSGDSYGYIGIMPICSAEIKPFTDAKNQEYSLSAWEGLACIYGLGSQAEGPINYKYTGRRNYHHTIIKKIAEDKIEYIFDDNIWILTVPKLKNLSTLHIGARDNPMSRDDGQNVYYKNIEVVELIPRSSQASQPSNPTPQEPIPQEPQPPEPEPQEPEPEEPGTTNTEQPNPNE